MWNYKNNVDKITVLIYLMYNMPGIPLSLCTDSSSNEKGSEDCAKWMVMWKLSKGGCIKITQYISSLRLTAVF